MGRLRTAVLLALVAAGVVGCSTPRSEVDAAQRQWDSIPDEVRAALGLGEPEGSAWGSVGEHWKIEAPLGIAATGDPAVLGSGITSACHAVVDALAGTDVQAFGVLPLVDGVVRATHESCDRGLALGSWSTELGSADSPGRWTELGDLVLGRERDGRAEMLGPRLQLAAGIVSTSSTTPPWTSTVIPFDPADWDDALAAASTPLPLVAPGEGQVVLITPAGTAVTGTAECATGERDTEVTVASPVFVDATISSITVNAVPDGEPVPGRVGCGRGPAGAPILPTLSYTTAAGEAIDVAVVAIGRPTVWGSRLTASITAG
ncbi:Hypothetical protein KLENKIAIHU_4026 [Klenkia terrae]|uniref:hypothetical protein n=1 Tax=Klenkia terrae TaxID=1052259 RepID=UPI0017781A62|nr:hypothetical protein [Klenkia terrae]SSC25402.1 Hypothetical protein KLENKIAIHU_4026 [Klenkia terrae]